MDLLHSKSQALNFVGHFYTSQRGSLYGRHTTTITSSPSISVSVTNTKDGQNTSLCSLNRPLPTAALEEIYVAMNCLN